MKLNFTLFTILLFISLTICGQTEKKVLFIGNSYTSVNNLPLVVSNMATSAGDLLVYDANTPGGYRFLNHATNSTTLQKIHSNDWDYVVLQEQSQLPAFPEFQKLTELYPYARALCDTIRANNECTEPMFYMTWGRENGDPQNCANAPWFCTYESMDDSIRATYIHMAEMYQTELAPAGAVWRYLRENNPEINLYSSDGSHPSIAGSYAAGCAFYATIFKKDPTLITWNSSLTEVVANAIKTAAKIIVYDQLNIWDYSINPAIAGFSEVIDANSVSYTNTSAATDSVFWDFGDGNFSNEFNPSHSYTETGTFEVSLINYKCGKSDTLVKSISIETLGLKKTDYAGGLNIFPNPASQYIQLSADQDYQLSSYSIADLAGRQIVNNQHLSSNLIDISQLGDGIYILSGLIDGKIVKVRFLKVSEY